MMEIDNCCLVVVDVQGKLAQLMHEKDKLFANIQILIRTAKILEVPILWCQQVPEALGATVGEIAELLADSEPINKFAFSCWGDLKFKEKLRSLNRSHVILCGIETHVCIYQTAVDLQQHGFHPSVIADAVSSRTKSNYKIALKKMQAIGIDVASTEMLLFELLKTAEQPYFKQIAKLVK